MKEYEEIKFVEKSDGYYFGGFVNGFTSPADTISMETICNIILNKGLTSYWLFDSAPILPPEIIHPDNQVFTIRIYREDRLHRITEVQHTGRELLTKLKNLSDIDHRYRKEKEKVYNNKGIFTLREGCGEDGTETHVHVDYFGNGVSNEDVLLAGEGKVFAVKGEQLRLQYNQLHGISSGFYIVPDGTDLGGGWGPLNNFVMKDGVESMETEFAPEARVFGNLKEVLDWLRTSKGLGEAIENYEKVLELDRLDQLRAIANEERRKQEDVKKQTKPSSSGQYSKEEVLEIIKMIRPDLDLESGLVKRLLG